MSEERRQGLSFGFSKKIDSKKLDSGALGGGKDVRDDEKEIVTSLEDKEVQGTKPKVGKEKLVIPLIQSNKWRSRANKENDVANGTSANSAESQAVKEILEETARRNDEWEERDGKNSTNVSIPLLMRNKIPTGYETDDRLDVSLRPEQSEDADYEQIPIEQFGVAMLRGMGWKDGEGIGKNKKLVAPVEAKLRPKGLGLGADRSAAQSLDKKNNKSSSKVDEEETLTYKVGAYGIVEKGPHRDLYGKVEGMDEDNARVMVKLATSGTSINISQYGFRLVHKKEYEKYSRYINKAKSDRYKEKEAEKVSRDESKERKLKDRSEESSSKSSKKKRKHDHYDYREDKSSQEDQNGSHSDIFWIQPLLRVRIVDKHYKNGKYYNKKVEIIDVISRSSQTCICRSEDGKVLEDIKQSMLETVIPRSDNAPVMIVSGKYSGQFGEIIKKDKSKCRATIQLLKDRDCAVKVDYDSLCEYLGDIHTDMDY